MTVQHVLFDPEGDPSHQPDTLLTVIGQAVGAASVCWEDMSGTGEFESQRARVIVDEVITWINEHYVGRPEVYGSTLPEAPRLDLPGVHLG